MSESDSSNAEENPMCDMNGEQRKQDFNAFVKRFEFLEEVEAEQQTMSTLWVMKMTKKVV